MHYNCCTLHLQMWIVVLKYTESTTVKIPCGSTRMLYEAMHSLLLYCYYYLQAHNNTCVMTMWSNLATKPCTKITDSIFTFSFISLYIYNNILLSKRTNYIVCVTIAIRLCCVHIRILTIPNNSIINFICTQCGIDVSSIGGSGTPLGVGKHRCKIIVLLENLVYIFKLWYSAIVVFLVTMLCCVPLFVNSVASCKFWVIQASFAA